MLYGEISVDIDKLKTWSAHLGDSAARLDETGYQIVDKCLKLQLRAFKKAVNNLSSGDDWRSTIDCVSPAFMKRYFRATGSAIRIANYYECFVEPMDISTTKRMVLGYGDHTEIGEIAVFKNGRQIGSLGVKSDLAWSVFSEYFIVEDEYGYVTHTLADHEQFMSLQLWDVGDADNNQISVRINNLLVELSIKSGLNFRRSYPNELWKSPGNAGVYRLSSEDTNLEPIPLAYLSYGLTAEDPRVAYLHCYQTMEYFFIRAQNDSLIDELVATGVLEQSPTNHNELRKVLRHYRNTQREVESLKLVLFRSIEASWLRSYVSSNRSLVNQYTIDSADVVDVRINLNTSDKKLIDKLAERIYRFRCAIVHAKGDVDDYIAQPYISEEKVEAEIPLLREVAYKVLVTWGSLDS